MLYCPHCRETRPPHDHRRVFAFGDRTHVVVMLAPTTRFELTDAGRRALQDGAE